VRPVKEDAKPPNQAQTLSPIYSPRADKSEYPMPCWGGELYLNEWYCSCCGHIQDMSLKERVFNCQQCNVSINRDLNAACNLEHQAALILKVYWVKLAPGAYQGIAAPLAKPHPWR
jgi:hypothetical protein